MLACIVVRVPIGCNRCDWNRGGLSKMTSTNPTALKPAWTPETDKGFVYFDERLLQSVEDLTHSFKLRYQVYCEEMEFLDTADYPHGVETDVYDRQSLHFGSFNKEGAIVGTVRLVRGGGIENVPMHQHCRLHEQERDRLEGISDLVEVSRLAVSKKYRRRAGDGLYGLSGMPNSPGSDGRGTYERREVAFPTVLRLYRVVYHGLKERGVKDVLASMETTLFRILRVLRFPFREIGPEVDYYGPVRPYYLDLDELDLQLVEWQPDLLQYFNYGLDPRFQSAQLVRLAQITTNQMHYASRA